MQINLTQNEITELLQQDPASANAGGFQNFMVRLGERVDRQTGALVLSDEELERLDRYAHNYGGGGFQNRIISIFGREIGAQRGWQAA